MGINENNLTSFYGCINERTYPMELAYTALCSGAYMDYYKNEQTGLETLVALIPKANGTVQPVEVTFGNPDSVAIDNRIAIYHSLGLDRIVNEKGNSNDTNSEILAQRFASIASTLGQNNEYINGIFEAKAAELRKRLLENYPENIKEYDSAVESYKDAFAKAFDMKGKDANKDEKKKPNDGITDAID